MTVRDARAHGVCLEELVREIPGARLVPPDAAAIAVSGALAASFAYFVVLRISEAQEAKRNAWGRGGSGTLPIDPRDAVA